MMIAGTASHAGKSWFATAICRCLKRRGLRVAPFKAQNMSNNSYPCREGGEIGRAQAEQAEACGLEPSAAMNPVLLKPESDGASQVIVDGKVWRRLSARQYYDHFDYLNERVMAAYRLLAAEYEFIVIEGAGSVTEMNLKRTDLVNLGLARRTGARALLVADIDRGGVFASLVGTFALLEPEEAALVPAFAVNRFRGDVSLFADGVDFLEHRTGRKCLGVFPHAADIPLAAEDGLSLDAAPSGNGRIAILRFPRVSNFTDFAVVPGAVWIDRPVPRKFDAVILPGSKSVIADLEWMRRRGLDRWVLAQHADGARIVGVCGGYQMLGEHIGDPYRVESDTVAAEGLALLPVTTTLEREKTTRVVDAVTPLGRRFTAYEIHMGRTTAPPGAEPFALVDGKPEGIRQGRVAGAYLHGAFEDPGVAEEFLGAACAPRESKDSVYEALADWFERNGDMRRFEELYL
jgi:adenosylcobyric acid synthase